MAHQVRTNKTLTDLPGVGRVEGVDVVVLLSDEQYAMIPASAFSGGSPVLDDLGQVGPAGDAVLTQAANVAAMGSLTSAAPSALTSSQNSTTNGSDLTTTQALANALKVSYNAAQVDIAALRTTLLNTQADVATLRTKLNATLAAITGTGLPMSS